MRSAPPTDGWTALVLAGERPGGDPLAARLGVPMKALVPVCGRTLIDRVLTPLVEVGRIRRIVVLAQDIETLRGSGASAMLGHPRVSLVQSGTGIAASIEAVAGTPPAPWPVLVTTADNALLTPERVETFLDEAGGVDLAIGVGARALVERAYPEAQRTWLKFSDGQYSGANLFALSGPRCTGALRKWAEVEQDRKKGLKLVASFGPALLLRVLTRTIAFPAALARAAAGLGCSARPVVLDAEAPIDVDKPSDLELVERILAARTTGASPRSGIIPG